ncbi:MAG TPA: glutaredoxin domain-containing protein, partial [Stellaceae bacterium]|nr:glutaredoxin domain-containing protein [Stellaceae bacterium]
MAEVELYTTMFCPYCARARALLERKGVAFTEIDIIEEPARRDEMIRRAG